MSALPLLMLPLLVHSGVIGFATGQSEGKTYSKCQQQFLDALKANGRESSAGMVDLIDPDTPDDACVLPLCLGDYAACDPVANGPENIKKDPMILVFSDEFEKEGRTFDVKSKDPRWTAEDIYYFPTQDIEVYKPEQITTYKGKAVITIEETKKPESAPSLQPDGTKWDVTKNYKSAMVNSWNKFCFTGGYMEMSVRMPADDKVPGFWPAFWAMGNLGRAGYMPSTGGFWPYSYNECGKGSNQSTAIPGSLVPSQRVSACIQNEGDPGYINRTKYGFEEGKARNSPEFDVFEVVVNREKGTEASQTLQMAPLVPQGTSWADLEWYTQDGVPDGVTYPGGISFLRTERNPWQGKFGRPGNAYQDSLSAISHLNSSFHESFHTFGVDWLPGEYLRWYVDGIFAYEINANALRAMSAEVDGEMVEIGERMIPFEPMYMIFNLGMSRDFGEVDIENLPFPSYMMIDYVRVYQRPDQVNVGCNPPDYPTAQWIACNKKDFMTNPDDEILFETCESESVKSNLSLTAAAVTTSRVTCSEGPSSSFLAPCLRLYSTTGNYSDSDSSSDQHADMASQDRHVFDSTIRVANLSAIASTAFLQGLGHSKNRQDIRFILESEKVLLSETSRMMQDSQSRPSALQLAAKVGFKGAGIAASMLPPFVRNSVLAGLNEAVEDSCIDQLRELRAKGLSESNPELRSLMMRIRDHGERVPEGAPQVPDVMSLPEISKLKPDQALAFIVKQGTSTLLHISKKL